VLVACCTGVLTAALGGGSDQAHQMFRGLSLRQKYFFQILRHPSKSGGGRTKRRAQPGPTAATTLDSWCPNWGMAQRGAGASFSERL
jgi:hypothetical protein